MKLTAEDLVLIRKALQAYLSHIQPSASYVKEVASWYEQVNLIQDKISKILLNIKAE